MQCPSASLELETTEYIPRVAVIQDGDSGHGMPVNKQGRLPDIFRSTGCIPPHSNSPTLTVLPSVSMAGETIPVQGPPIQPLPGTTDIHEGSSPLTPMGMQARDSDQHLPGRPHHNSSIKGAVKAGHSMSTGKTQGAGLLDQVEQVTLGTDTMTAAPWIHNQYQDNVSQGPRQQDQGHVMGGQQDGTEGHSISSTAVIIHWKGQHDAQAVFPAWLQT